jgi:hypothetical protein
MHNVIARDRVVGQFRAAADAVLGIAIQEDEKIANSIAEIPAYVTGEEETLIPDTPEDNRPGEVVRAVANKLTAAGFDVRAPDPDDGRRLTIFHAECARCEVVIEDDGSVRWEYRPATGCDTDPAVMTEVVLRALAVDDSAGRGASPRLGVTLKGAVGSALDARGLDVRMLVYEDLICYDVAAEIVVANPARPDRGQIRQSDDGSITWECSCRDAVSGSVGEVVDAVVGVIGRAIALSRSAGRSRNGDLH